MSATTRPSTTLKRVPSIPASVKSSDCRFRRLSDGVQVSTSPRPIGSADISSVGSVWLTLSCPVYCVRSAPRLNENGPRRVWKFTRELMVASAACGV